jgi:hypothetical protein
MAAPRWISVRDFITAEEMADPTRSVQPNIQRALATAQGGRVVFPSGVYRIDQPIQVDYEGAILEGASIGGSILGAGPSASGGAVVRAMNDYSQGTDPHAGMIDVLQHLVCVRNIAIDGNGVAVFGVRAGNAKGCLDNIAVTKTLSAGVLLHEGKGNPFSWNITGCRVFGNFKHGIRGDEICHDTHIAFSTISNNAGDGIHVTGPAVLISVQDCNLEVNCQRFWDGSQEVAYIFIGQLVNQVRISNCYFEDGQNPEGNVAMDLVGSFLRARGPTKVFAVEGCYFNNSLGRLRHCFRILDDGESGAQRVRVRECIMTYNLAVDAFEVAPRSAQDFVQQDNVAI